MRKIMVSLLLVMSMALPIAIHGQDTEVPTVESFETATAVAQPTLEPTEVPAPPAPSPVDLSLLLPWVLTIGIVAISAVVAIAWVGIVQAAKGAPAWLRPILLANLDKGVDVLDDLTSGDIADAGIAKLRQEIAELKAELNKTNVKVDANTQAVQAVARSQGS